jgi:hypothetical protein
MLKRINILIIFISLSTSVLAQTRYKIAEDFQNELNALLTVSEPGPEDSYFTVAEPFALNGKGFLSVKLKYYTADSSFYHIRYQARVNDIIRIYYDGLTVGFAFNDGKVNYSRSGKGSTELEMPIAYSFMPITNIKDEKTAKAAIKKLETMLEAVKKLY